MFVCKKQKLLVFCVSKPSKVWKYLASLHSVRLSFYHRLECTFMHELNLICSGHSINLPTLILLLEYLVGVYGQIEVFDVVFARLSLSLCLHRILFQNLQCNLLLDELFDVFERCSAELQGLILILGHLVLRWFSNLLPF